MKCFNQEKKNEIDINKKTIATFTLPVESIEKLNEIIENSLKAGGSESYSGVDEGFMQKRGIKDLDGHRWDFIFLDLEKFKKLKNRQ